VTEVKTEGARASLQRLAAAFHYGVSLTMRTAVDVAEGSAKSSKLFRDQTGGTRGSVRGRIAGMNSGLPRGFVEARGAMRLLESGTSPHTITARGQTLRFVSGGITIFRRSVRHPGTKPRPIMATARLEAERAVRYGAQIYINNAIKAGR
jgi:hypothetical protein